MSIGRRSQYCLFEAQHHNLCWARRPFFIQLSSVKFSGRLLSMPPQVIYAILFLVMSNAIFVLVRRRDITCLGLFEFITLHPRLLFSTANDLCPLQSFVRFVQWLKQPRLQWAPVPPIATGQKHWHWQCNQLVEHWTLTEILQCHSNRYTLIFQTARDSADERNSRTAMLRDVSVRPFSWERWLYGSTPKPDAAFAESGLCEKFCHGARGFATGQEC